MCSYHIYLYKRKYYCCLQNVKNYSLMNEVCCLSVCLSHYISQFLDIYRKFQIFQNTRGQMRQWMTCWLATSLIYCAWIIHLSAKQNQNKKIQLWLYRTFHYRNGWGGGGGILHISKKNTLQLEISRCLKFFIRDTLHSADPSKT